MTARKPISTDAAVKGAKSDPQKDVEIQVTGATGLRLRIKPSGAKSWTLRYRLKDTKERKRYTLGSYGKETGLAWARSEAAKILGKVANGEDPSADAKAKRTGATMADLWERYLEEHATKHKKESSVRMDELNWKNHIEPRFGSKRINTVTRAEVQKLHHEIGKPRKVARKNPKTGKKRKSLVLGGKGVANRVLALLSKMFSFAEAVGLRPQNSNPCKHVQRYQEKGRQRFLDAAERCRLEAVLTKAEGRGPREKGYLAPGMITAVRLLSATGCRLGEIVNLQWGHVDLAGRRLRLPDSKTGAKVVVLSSAAVEILQKAKTTRGASLYVCPTETGGPLKNVQRSWRLIREAAKLDGVTLHTLRHSFASDAIAGGVPLAIVGELLGHKSVLTTRRYQHLADQALKEAADQAGAAIERAAKGGQ